MILDRDGHTVERQPGAVVVRAVRQVGLLERRGVASLHDRVDLRVEPLDAVEVRLEHLAAAHLAGAHEAGELGSGA